MTVTIKTAEEIARIKKACRVVAEVRETLAKEIRAGITTEDLDKLGEKLT